MIEGQIRVINLNLITANLSKSLLNIFCYWPNISLDVIITEILMDEISKVKYRQSKISRWNNNVTSSVYQRGTYGLCEMNTGADNFVQP